MIETESKPKYEKAYRTILDRLKSGRYQIGMRMPTEGELAGQFGISRVTIRRALDMLVKDGYVESRQGSGYRVLTLSPASDTCLTSFTDAMLRAGHEPTTRLVSLTTLPLGAKDLALLPPDLQREPVMRVTRLRAVDGVPRMVVNTFVPARLMPDAGPADFPEKGTDQSILRILGRRFGLEWSAACEDISPFVADAAVAALIGVSSGSALLRQACTAFAEDGSLVFYEDVYRTGSVSFNLSRQGRSTKA